MDDIFSHALKKQTGVALKYMLDFGANPFERQLMLSAQVRGGAHAQQTINTEGSSP